MLEVEALNEFKNEIKIKFNQFDEVPETVPILTPLEIPKMLLSERWCKKPTGIMIQQFWRKTNIIFKRSYLGGGRTQPLEMWYI